MIGKEWWYKDIGTSIMVCMLQTARMQPVRKVEAIVSWLLHGWCNYEPKTANCTRPIHTDMKVGEGRVGKKG